VVSGQVFFKFFGFGLFLVLVFCKKVFKFFKFSDGGAEVDFAYVENALFKKNARKVTVKRFSTS
tara:strand:- start:29 stop:220 length:192 start_codon:yes stop_codon:yes gene_type:complete